jgi:adenylate kinase
MENRKVIVLLGPPGSGKGTQSMVLQRELQIPAISTGDVLRAEMAANTPLGQNVRQTINGGNLVSDDLINKVARAQLHQPQFAQGFVLDGYPRTVRQANFLDELLAEMGMPEPIAMHLDATTETILQRLTARRQCPCCRRIYNQVLRPSKDGVTCDFDQVALITRDDDRESVILERLKTYRDLSQPVIDVYKHRRYVKIDGNLDPEEVFVLIKPLVTSASVSQHA